LFRWFADLPIERKLRVVITVPAMAAFAIALVMHVSTNLLHLRADMQQRAAGIARGAGVSAIEALGRGDTAVAAGRDVTDMPARIEAALDRFPVLRRKAMHQASTLSGGEQKQLEIARSLLLNPKLVMIDEPSIGLSPLMVQQTFKLLKELRDRGVSILMIEQNARAALEISDFGIVLELGQTRLADKAERVLSDPRIGQLFLGGAMKDGAA